MARTFRGEFLSQEAKNILLLATEHVRQSIPGCPGIRDAIFTVAIEGQKPNGRRPGGRGAEKRAELLANMVIQRLSGVKPVRGDT